MSTGADCRFTEVKPGQWTMWLQAWPYGETPDGETFGPFDSYSRALESLNDHANPGGYSTRCLPDGQHVHQWGHEFDESAEDCPCGLTRSAGGRSAVKYGSAGPWDAEARRWITTWLVVSVETGGTLASFDDRVLAQEWSAEVNAR